MIRRGVEHTQKDQYCADHNVFIIENLCNLDMVLTGDTVKTFEADIYPINFDFMSGLPCRVAAFVD